MIKPEMIPKIESTFGFHLYDWQKDYLLGKIIIEQVAGTMEIHLRIA